MAEEEKPFFLNFIFFRLILLAAALGGVLLSFRALDGPGHVLTNSEFSSYAWRILSGLKFEKKISASKNTAEILTDFDEQCGDNAADVHSTSELLEPLLNLQDDDEAEAKQRALLVLESVGKTMDALNSSIQTLLQAVEAWNTLKKLIHLQADRAFSQLEDGMKKREGADKDAGEVIKRETLSNSFLKVKEGVVRDLEREREFWKFGRGVGKGETKSFGRCNEAGDGDMYFRSSRILTWQAQENRYLLALCKTGQMSNRLTCLQSYIAFSALLNRTLIVPEDDLSPDTKYNMTAIVDIPHAQRCVGDRNIVSVREYLEKRNESSVNVKIFCLHDKSCGDWLAWQTSMRDLNKSFAISIDGTPEGAKMSHDSSEGVFLDVYGKLSDKVISFGEMVFFGYLHHPHMMFLRTLPNGPISLKDPSCKLLLQPDQAILQTAENIAQSFLSEDYAAMHLRRGDFFSFCTRKRAARDCYKPLSELASCFAAKLNVLDRSVKTVYLATNGGKDELEYFQAAVLASAHGNYTFLTLQDVWSSEAVRPLKERNWHEREEAQAMVDKILASKGRAFTGARGSTFSEHIVRLRAAAGTATCWDELGCTAGG